MSAPAPDRESLAATWEAEASRLEAERDNMLLPNRGGQETAARYDVKIRTLRDCAAQLRVVTLAPRAPRDDWDARQTIKPEPYGYCGEPAQVFFSLNHEATPDICPACFVTAQGFAGETNDQPARAPSEAAPPELTDEQVDRFIGDLLDRIAERVGEAPVINWTPDEVRAALRAAGTAPR